MGDERVWCGWCLDYVGFIGWSTHLEKHRLEDRREAIRNAKKARPG